jgi:hypothetical protein
MQITRFDFIKPYAITVVTAFCLLANVSPLQAAVDYLRDIKPVLKENCYKCHGSSQQKGGLRLDTAENALKGGEAGQVITPGKSSESAIIPILQGKHDSIPRMPYKKTPLQTQQIAQIAAWIDGGAIAPKDEAPEQATHWSFVPPHRLSPPKLASGESPRNPIDAFILARLEKEKIKPSPEADRVTLLRRLSLDLIGLPPTIEEVEQFLSDTRPDAYEAQVHRLLASAHFGERWGRWWLDAARYADSNGYSIDSPRQIWKYRDWVINAINSDMPFNQFAMEQLAGDLLPNPTIDQKIATGFNRNTQINQEGGIDPEQFRVESVIDRVNTFGTVFLGLTVGCAQCHDHKFDPISQKEYYQLYAFFNNTVQDGHGDGGPQGVMHLPTPDETEAKAKVAKAKEDMTAWFKAHQDDLQKWEESLDPEHRKKLNSKVASALKTDPDKRSFDQLRELFNAFDGKNPDFKEKISHLSRLEKAVPKAITTLVMQELPEPRNSTILIKGDFTRPGKPVEPGVPGVLHPLKHSGSSRANRLDLAHWLASPDNPITTRVVVNRIWQQYFGRGIVETENDFGTQGAAPTFPELLDWLATEFMHPSEPGIPAWSMKHIHQLIVTSEIYRQSSHARPDLDLVDPNNHLLARQSRIRLDAEIIRDAALEASGLLSHKIGGPPVYPPQPDGVMNLGQVKRDWTASKGADRYRRAIYTHYWRATPHPALAVFDTPDSFSACTRRLRSNTPLQALTLLNDTQFHEFAEALGERVMKESPADRITRLFEFCVSRKPSDREAKRLQQYLHAQANLPEKEQWTAMARVLLNTDEMITRE